MSLTSIVRRFFIPRQKELERHFKEPDTVQQEMLQYLLEKPDISVNALAEILNVSPRTIERALLYLRQANIIQRVGNKKKGSWLVVKGE